jgi:hypothetical protein
MIRRGGSGQLMRDRLTAGTETVNDPQVAETIGVCATQVPWTEAER